MKWYVLAFAMALTTYLIRLLPMLLRKPLRSRFVQSLLYYVPYACLSAMTVPGILTATGHIASGAAALLAAGVLAYRGKSLLVVSLGASAAALTAEGILLIG